MSSRGLRGCGGFVPVIHAVRNRDINGLAISDENTEQKRVKCHVTEAP